MNLNTPFLVFLLFALQLAAGADDLDYFEGSAGDVDFCWVSQRNKYPNFRLFCEFGRAKTTFMKCRKWRIVL